MDNIEYPYKPKPWIMLLSVLFFTICAVLIGNEASKNDRGLILNGIIKFDQEGATIFYWLLAGISATFVAIGIPLFFLGLVSKRVIKISNTEISAPKYGWSTKCTVVPLDSIKHISTQTINRQRFLHILHNQGKLTVVQGMLPNSAALEEIHRLLSQRIGRT